MNRLVSTLLIIVGIIHLLPLSGVLGAERLMALYSVAVTDQNIEIPMRHRAVLFGLLGAFMVYAALKPPLHVLAIVSGLVSVVSFITIAWATGDYNDALRKVVIADVIALVLLVVAGTARMSGASQAGR